MGFDAENFGFGLVAGWVTAYIVFRNRHNLQAMLTSAGERAATVQNSATRSADSRYVSDLIEQCETGHLAGAFAKLSDIVIEPRFLPTPEFAVPPDNEMVRSVYRVVPNIPDHPYLQAPYNVETLSISELATGATALALLGMPGSGRTTALQTIALHSLGRVRFTPPPDAVQAQLDAEEARLEEKERAVRVNERIGMEQRARERLANETGVIFNAEADEEQKKLIPLFNRLMPVYVHFADINAAQPEFGAEADPAEYVVRAVQATVKRVTASTIPGNLYSRLNRGQVLMLIDGFDDLPEAERPAALLWLKAFLEQYKQNFIIVTGPATGYGALLGTGLTPVFMRPWSDLDIRNAAERWAEAWRQMGRRRKAPALAPEVIARAATNARALSAFEATLKIWAAYAEDTQQPGIEGWIWAYLKRLIPSAEDFKIQLALLGALQLDEGFITNERMQTLAISDAVVVPEFIYPARGPALQELGGEGANSPEMPESVAAPEAPSPNDKKSKKPAEPSTKQDKLLALLRRSGLFVRYRGDRYRFRHPLLASYFASLSLQEVPIEVLQAKANADSWRDAIPYAALHTSLDRIVAERMQADPDLLQEKVVEMARWLAYASPDVIWRGPVLNYLNTQLIAPSQYPLIRERIAAALIDSRDKNVLLIFRRSVRNMDADIRRLACLGMGALADPDGLRDLASLLRDQDANVQLAAGMALGALGTEEALQPMIEALTTGTEQLRQAMAEALAAMPEVGYPTLYEAVSDQDFMLRRAAIFGLRRLRTTWALVAIYRAFLEDDQWYVRSAAQQAFQELIYGRSTSLTTAYPKPEEIVWLQEWAARRGENVPSGEGANQMLLRALQEGEAPIRTLAALNLGQLGMVDTVRALYGALRDGREEVRSAAHKALADLQLQIGQHLPSPV